MIVTGKGAYLQQLCDNLNWANPEEETIIYISKNGCQFEAVPIEKPLTNNSLSNAHIKKCTDVPVSTRIYIRMCIHI